MMIFENGVILVEELRVFYSSSHNWIKQTK